MTPPGVEWLAESTAWAGHRGTGRPDDTTEAGTALARVTALPLGVRGRTVAAPSP